MTDTGDKTRARHQPGRFWLFRGGVVTLIRVLYCDPPPHGRFWPRSGTETANVADQSAQTTIDAIYPSGSVYSHWAGIEGVSILQLSMALCAVYIIIATIHVLRQVHNVHGRYVDDIFPSALATSR